jgi:MoaA/NifB/PqqE/SkfB family radical SAM enzyme
MSCLYIQITNRCNMTCAHCCFNCHSTGNDMSKDNFHKAVAFAKSYGEQVCIGGGEPTLHPDFKEFLMHAVYEMVDSESVVDLTTNGSNTEIALTLASLAKKGIISCALSQDQYHDPIEKSVIEAFTDKRRINYGDDPRDSRGNKSNDLSYIATGRGARLSGGSRGCACESLFVAPSGMVYPCGCRQTKLGNIGKLKSLPSYYFQSYCERSREFKEAKEEEEELVVEK